ncbi:degenerate transposase [Streptococcus pneumoniae]|uniref:Degenerate transposase n=1 Tax=Streptococcus pneumoniae TaxID=1313 RepID=A0A0U0PRL9_STREE|nr:degenerate transposase [Streptococcus pneumoniae]CEX52197.1 degenerate transposase [Streptococcus pneumoniae]CEX83011.1 degenerate transposase [Streptococcus pneumoniae]CGF22556.1 degenerate transposase [Streptococcus pneumoniae]CGF76076.1 degenerate transposase [Streptococcus pneumoniae]
MKSDKTIIRKIHMEQLHFITKLLDIKDPNIKILDIINMDTHKEIIAKLDYEAPSCPDCGSLMKKYDFQKPSKIPYLETTVCLLEFSLENAVSSAITVQK